MADDNKRRPSDANEFGTKRRRTASKADSVESQAKETEYYFENGLRKVRPYEFEYKAHAKGRWYGREVLEIFVKEFADMSTEYYTRAIETGLISVNGQRVDPSYRIKNGDMLSNRIFRHEPPVCGDAVQIIKQTEDLLVINKPGSMPVHPSGRYRHNSVLYILQREMGFKQLFSIHRLDRLTSGVLLLSLTKAKAQQLQAQMVAHEFVKEYICRVKGEFPAEEITIDKPIKTFDFKLGINCVAPDGKECRTLFRRLSYNGRTSRPFTGRTHQIRVHLQYLGYPIANDPLYLNAAWGPTLGKGGVTPQELAEVVKRFREGRIAVDVAAKLQHEQQSSSINSETNTSTSSSHLPTNESEQVAPPHLPNLKRDPLPHELYIYLHAFRYSGSDWTFEAPNPDWAKDDFEGDQWLQEPDAIHRLSENMLDVEEEQVQQ